MILRAHDLPSAAYDALDGSPPVYFVARQLRRRWPELSTPDSYVELARVPRARLAPNENIWIVSTYLRLKSRGMNVRITDRLVPDHVNVCSDVSLLWKWNRQSHRAFVVTAKGDQAIGGWGNYHLAQSPALVRDRSSCLIDMWPQPGLIPRDPSRGMRVERLGYVGPLFNLAAPFRSESFRRQLADIGVELVMRADSERWHDFSDLDLFLAVRHDTRYCIRTKPATKLVHAWLTGCVALLGDEPSYRYWGEDGRDYFQVRTPEEAIEVVRRLKEDPAHYRSVQELGWAKGPLHDEESVCRQWAAVLAGPVTESFERWRSAGEVTVLMRAAWRQVQKPLTQVTRRLFYLRAEGIRGFCRGLARRLGSDGRTAGNAGRRESG